MITTGNKIKDVKVYLILLVFIIFLAQVTLGFGNELTYSWVRPQNCSCVATGGGSGNNSYFNATDGNFTYLWSTYFNASNTAFLNNLVSNKANITQLDTVNINSTGIIKGENASFNGTLQAVKENITSGNATYYYLQQLNVTVISFGGNNKIMFAGNLPSANDLSLVDNVNFISPYTYDSSRKQNIYTDSDALLMTDGGVASYQAVERTPINLIVQTSKLPTMQIQGTGNGNVQNGTIINNSFYNMSQNCQWVKVLMNFTASNQRNFNGYFQVCYPVGVGWGGNPSPGIIPNQAK